MRVDESKNPILQRPDFHGEQGETLSAAAQDMDI